MTWIVQATGRSLQKCDGRENPGIDPAYDTIGVGYTRVRREDPRIAARIRAALGDARTVVNVGAGAGAE